MNDMKNNRQSEHYTCNPMYGHPSELNTDYWQESSKQEHQHSHSHHPVKEPRSNRVARDSLRNIRGLNRIRILLEESVLSLRHKPSQIHGVRNHKQNA